MEWYLTLPAVYRFYRDEEKKMESVLQICNHQITHMRHEKFPFTSPHTPAAVSGARRQVSAITPGSIRSLQRFSTVCEEKNTLKLTWDFVLSKKKKKWQKHELNGVKW